MSPTDWMDVVLALEAHARESTLTAARAVDTEDELLIQVEMTRMRTADLALERARARLARMTEWRATA